MEENNDSSNSKKRKVYIRPEDTLELVYEICDKWKETDDPIESMKNDLRSMIRYFKEEKFEKLREEFRINY